MISSETPVPYDQIRCKESTGRTVPAVVKGLVQQFVMSSFNSSRQTFSLRGTIRFRAGQVPQVHDIDLHTSQTMKPIALARMVDAAAVPSICLQIDDPYDLLAVAAIDGVRGGDQARGEEGEEKTTSTTVTTTH